MLPCRVYRSDIVENVGYFLCWKNPKSKIPSQSYSAFAFGN
ncbi:hypothetical protein APHNP_0427 [Anaplasma phagocytophilum str. ApNP]|uniref:Uncharacterized protein n=1 Tax=Anaplasma phagocytophilum str. ApNP TaxID=1359153 RepID=A0A0F3NID7_ANAPH|nr:hypothetical protein APHNP_0427 [Anaplasma phagocytophilum str. ApNP]